MYLPYTPYFSQFALIEAFFDFVSTFTNEFEHFVELTRLNRPHASPEEEHLLFQCNMIQLALFDRSLEQQLKKRRVRRADLTDREEALAFRRWAKKYGECFHILLKEHRTDWCKRFEEFEPQAHAVLGRRSTSAERQVKRRAETELELLFQEIEALL